MRHSSLLVSPVPFPSSAFASYSPCCRASRRQPSQAVHHPRKTRFRRSTRRQDRGPPICSCPFSQSSWWWSSTLSLACDSPLQKIIRSAVASSEHLTAMSSSHGETLTNLIPIDAPVHMSDVTICNLHLRLPRAVVGLRIISSLLMTLRLYSGKLIWHCPNCMLEH